MIDAKTYTILDLNKITVGNSFDILPTLADNCCELILTDVPYDLSIKQQSFLQMHFMRLARRCIIVFSPPENQWTFDGLSEYLFWIKPISTKNTSRHYSRFVEMIFIYPRHQYVWNCKRHWSQYTNVFMDLVDNSNKHPYRKPPSLIERLILNHSKEGDTILDPFAGSGSVFEVCKRTNRNFIGIEINEEYLK